MKRVDSEMVLSATRVFGNRTNRERRFLDDLIFLRNGSLKLDFSALRSTHIGARGDDPGFQVLYRTGT